MTQTRRFSRRHLRDLLGRAFATPSVGSDADLAPLLAALERSAAALGADSAGGGGARSDRERLARVVEELDRLSEHQPEGFRPSVALTLIGIRDRIAVRDGESPPADWLDDRVVRALSAMGVSAIEDGGALDEARHEVVVTRPTDDPAKHEHIAETLRAGYRTETELLRVQQVVAWENSDARR